MEPNICTVEGLSGLVFLAFVGITIAGALIATNAKRLVRSVAGLCLCFMGVSGLYYFLNSPFVAMMELLIYVGAVAIVIVFAVMLSEPRMEDKVGKQSGIGALFGSIGGGLVFAAVWLTGRQTNWLEFTPKANNGSLEDVGMALLTNFSMVFELISILLLVSIIGALVLARTGRDSEKC